MARQIAGSAEVGGGTYLCPQCMHALVLASSDFLPTLPLPLNTHMGIAWQYVVENKELNFQRGKFGGVSGARFLLLPKAVNMETGIPSLKNFSLLVQCLAKLPG